MSRGLWVRYNISFDLFYFVYRNWPRDLCLYERRTYYVRSRYSLLILPNENVYIGNVHFTENTQRPLQRKTPDEKNIVFYTHSSGRQAKADQAKGNSYKNTSIELILYNKNVYERNKLA